MSYYRDERNPEAVHFPAKLHVAAINAFLLIGLLVTAVVTWIYGRGTQLRDDLAMAAACVAVVALYYPKRITTDETGIHAGRFLGFGRRSIRWDEIDGVRERALVPVLPPFSAGFLSNWVVEVRSVVGARPIRLTCRHSGRKAFLHELKRWGAPDPVLRNALDRDL